MASRQLDEEAIFHVARDLANPSTRSNYLDQVCGGDYALRERVEELLNVHEREEEFLKSSSDPGPTAELPPVAESPGQQIGRYKLLQKIGEGGFGVVYMAEQQRPVRRKVALKIIKPGMDTQAVIARFEAERQALALMDSPNIARVLDGGSTESGRPYFVMELVKGVPITEYCDKNELPTQARLELFVTVCQSVQHAHQKGIIHRDLKPSNILVTLHDGKPVVKVIDFGVAKAINQQLTERTLFTAFGQMVGTPQYMSPEQAEMSGLDIDTRSDIYSLGVVLYELLTGTTPLEAEKLRSAGYAEMQRLIREEETPKPSTRLSGSGERLTIIAKHRSATPERLHKLVRGDLDWIVMKALEKDRARRFESATALAQDVERFLNFAPIDSRPPSTSYRLRRFIRRHRVAIAMSSVMGIAVLSAVMGIAIAQVANNSRQKTLFKLRNVLFDHGVTLIMNAEAGKAQEVVGQLNEAGSVDLAMKLQAIRLLHEHEYEKAIQLLEPVVQQYPDDAGLRAMLSDAYDQAGDINKFVQSHQVLKTLDKSELDPVELVYAALANIVEPKLGYELADRAVKENPASPYARLVRSRMAVNYAQRSWDPPECIPNEQQLELVDKALADVEFLKLLYEYDNRIPSLSLSIYVLAAKARQRVGDSRWQSTLHMADDVVEYLKAKSPTDWNRYYLAQYYITDSEDTNAEAKVWNLYQEAAIGDKSDYITTFFLAMCHERNQIPIPELTDRISSDSEAVFGKYGLGCWYALNEESGKAREQVRGLVNANTISSVTYAIMILHLLKDETAAAKVAQEYADTLKGHEQITSIDWFEKDLFEFFRTELTNSPPSGTSAQDDLLRSARESDYPAAYGSFSLWAIGLRFWVRNEQGSALRCFQECMKKGQFEFPHHAWSRAILRRVDGEETGPR